ncbi:CRISPR-associated endonuclease Cas1 [Novipirellula aureliae]|uniref:CRISPR-associated endonuclease Cas1 n=1 Tax=Novipirellula aureliae TaxID=2527966 RepID=A0A5C6E4L1_9BACT|nr:hypothetical protein [Novipirellula aureliae]TWU43872.1 CRISPR-associated endonuclease Cas1 [Novipirellula aureliae]
MRSQKPREILHSKRGNLQYLEHCRVLVKEGRVLFLQEERARLQFWFDETKRLQVAKFFQSKRIEFLRMVWSKDRRLIEFGFDIEEMRLSRSIDAHAEWPVFREARHAEQHENFPSG